MLEYRALIIDIAFTYYGDLTGKYLSMIDNLSNGYQGNSLSQRNHKLLDEYFTHRGYEGLEDAKKAHLSPDYAKDMKEARKEASNHRVQLRKQLVKLNKLLDIN